MSYVCRSGQNQKGHGFEEEGEKLDSSRETDIHEILESQMEIGVAGNRITSDRWFPQGAPKATIGTDNPSFFHRTQGNRT
jgi:hypothetical protein